MFEIAKYVYMPNSPRRQAEAMYQIMQDVAENLPNMILVTHWYGFHCAPHHYFEMLPSYDKDGRIDGYWVTTMVASYSELPYHEWQAAGPEGTNDAHKARLMRRGKVRRE
jgi:hypothetical protein